jgi:dTDP-glucose 4,6-dehydratase
LEKYPDDKIVNLDKLTYAGHLSSTRDFSGNKNYKFIKGDICDPVIVKEAMKDINVVVHFAAESHVDRSILGCDVFLKTNILGTHVLLDEALKQKVDRFHYISTDEVFGSLELGSKEKFTEKSNYDPKSPYSASKAAADHLVRAYANTYSMDVTISNCSNNFGPYADAEKFIPRMITYLIDGKPLPIYGDGKNVRDWLYVTDHCRAIDLIIHKGKKGETYLIGGQTEDISNLELAERLLKIFGKDKNYIKFIKDRPGHDRRYAVDWTKINKELGWKPEHDFDTWLVKTVEWYQENESWWRPLKEKAEKLYQKIGQI